VASSEQQKENSTIFPALQIPGGIILQLDVIEMA
jgi:hypothetical protein